MTPSVESIRQRLGIPASAQRILVFTESSHWDPNWMLTSEVYFDRFVRRNLDQAVAALQREPRRVYGVECIFFLRMYWERCPDRREAVRALVNEGRLRLTGSGVTTADTLLPSAEAILRDWLLGQEWLRRNGMTQEPGLMVFTDSFGSSPALPSLLRAAGFDRTAITRIDGMYFMACDLESARRFPRPGTSAEELLRKERSLDFIWRDVNGAEVLCHWNAFSYGQGDMLAFRGLSRVYLVRFAIPARSDRHIARRIGQYVKDLAPVSRTPYMLCPIGFDFVEPIPDLIELLDRYNRNHYPTTGVWAVNAGFDDYLALVEGHREALPVIALDPNPYWTGFYTARPGLKRRCRELVDGLLLAERGALRAGGLSRAQVVAEDLQDAWWAAATSNHHDFITGTSPDSVVDEEQLPWLARAETAVEATLRQQLPAGIPPERCGAPDLPVFSRQGGRLMVQTVHHTVTFAENAGGAIDSIRLSGEGAHYGWGPANDLISYRDSGGLWRMGYEFRGGTWRERARASDRPVHLEVHEHAGGVEVVSTSELDGEPFLRRVWLSNRTPLIWCRVEGRAPEGHSVTVRIPSGLRVGRLVMDTPGGVVARPLGRYYDPTFWPVEHFVHVRDKNDGRGLALMLAMPGAVSCAADGSVELVATRNATRETAFGFIGLPANPAKGRERTAYAFDYALLFTQRGDWKDNALSTVARGVMDGPWGDRERAAWYRSVTGDFTTDRADVWVTAAKPASRGEGVVVRLYASAVPDAPVILTSRDLALERAFLCDARERDLLPLHVQNRSVTVPMVGTIATVRLLDEV